MNDKTFVCLLLFCFSYFFRSSLERECMSSYSWSSACSPLMWPSRLPRLGSTTPWKLGLPLEGPGQPEICLSRRRSFSRLKVPTINRPSTEYTCQYKMSHDAVFMTFTLTTLRMAMALVPAFTENPQQQDVRQGIFSHACHKGTYISL